MKTARRVSRASTDRLVVLLLLAACTPLHGEWIRNGSAYFQSSGSATIGGFFDYGLATSYTQTGGTVTVDRFDYLGYVASSSWNPNSSITYSLSGGLFSVSNLTLGIRRSDYGSAYFFQTGGTATISNTLKLGSGVNTGQYTLSGGTLTTGVLDLSGLYSINEGRFTLNGGTLATSNITTTRNGLLLFNGGTLEAIPNWSSPDTGWINSGTTAYISTGGARIHTAGTDRAIYAGFTHDPSLGANQIDGGFTKLGAGTLTIGWFAPASTYTGATTLGEGTLSIGIADALGASTNAINFSGGTLQIKGQFADGQSAGTTPVDFGSRTLNTTTFDGGLDIADADHTFTLSQSLSGTGALTKSGAGALVLTGANTHTGGTTVSAGTLQVGAGGTSGSLAGNIANHGALVFNRSDASTHSGVISGTGNLTKLGAGTLTLSAVNTYTGGTTVSGGTLALTRGGATGAIRGALTIGPGATVETSAVDALGFSTGGKVDSIVIDGGTLRNSASGNSGWGVAYTLGNGATLTSNGGVSSTTAVSAFAFGGPSGGNTSVNVTGGDNTIAGHIKLRGDNNNPNVDFSVGSGAMLHITAGISSSAPNAITPGPVGLTKLGAGTMILSAVNTYTGGTTVNGGTLEVARGGQVGGIRGALTINPGATVVTSANNALGWGAGTKIDSLTITGGTLNHTAANSHGLGIAYTLDGATMISNGGVSDATAASHFSVDGASSFHVGGATPSTIAGRLSLRGDGGFTNVNFTVANGSTLNVTAGISSQSGATLPGPIGFTKLGAGTMTLTGANIYSGATFVSAGTLRVDGSATNSAFTVQSGGTLTGSGSVGPTTVLAGGFLAPGNSPGLLTVNGDLTLASASFTTLEIAGLSRGTATGYDAVNISGAFTAGGTLSVSFIDGFVPAGSATFDFFHFTSFGGSFAQVNLPTVAGYTWNTADLSLDGTVSLVASAIPEPASFATLAALAVAGVSVSRRRRSA